METIIKWNEGDGNIIATYTGSGNAPINIASDVANEGIDREQTIQVATADNTRSVDVIVKQVGLREELITLDDDVLYSSDNQILGALKK